MTAALILAAGVGSRLMPITTKIPKPFLPFENSTIVGRIINRLISDIPECKIYSNLFHLPQTALEILESENLMEKISVKIEDELKGPAGSILTFEEELILEDEIIIISGDIVFDCSLEDMLKSHRESHSRMTVATCTVLDGHRFGVFTKDHNGLAVGIREKPNDVKGTPSDISAGIYIIDKSLISEIPKNKVWDFGSDWIPKLLKTESINLFKIDGLWEDIGNIDVYQRIVLEHSELDKNQYKDVHFDGLNYISRNASLGKNLYLKNCVIMPTAVIPNDACLVNAVVC